MAKGEIEIDESYFGARCVRGKRGRGAYDKAIVFGLKQRNRKVFTQSSLKVSLKTAIIALIRGKISKSVLYTDRFKT